jgi:hypothetical protein
MNHYFFINNIIFFSFAQLIEIQAPFIKIVLYTTLTLAQILLLPA